jgi:hypothetical protein
MNKFFKVKDILQKKSSIFKTILQVNQIAVAARILNLCIILAGWYDFLAFRSPGSPRSCSRLIH